MEARLIFIGGSKTDGHVILAAIFAKQTFEYRVHSACTVYIAELYVMYKTLFCAFCENFESFVILTDSWALYRTLMLLNQYIL